MVSWFRRKAADEQLQQPFLVKANHTGAGGSHTGPLDPGLAEYLQTPPANEPPAASTQPLPYQPPPAAQAATPSNADPNPYMSVAPASTPWHMRATAGGTPAQPRRSLYPLVSFSGGTAVAPAPPSGISSIEPGNQLGPDTPAADFRSAREGGATGLYPTIPSLSRSNSDPGRRDADAAAAPGVVHYTEASGLVTPPHEGRHVVAQQGLHVAQPGAGEPPPPAAEETLVTVPGAMVHLVDGRQSVLLAGGPLSLVRVSQGGSGVVAFARVGGSDLQWPLGWDEPVVQLDRLHYVFNLQVPAGDEEEEEEAAVTGAPRDGSGSAAVAAAAEGGARQQQEGGAGAAYESIAYGVTFEPNTPPEVLAALDALLEQYCAFTRPGPAAAGDSQGQPSAPPPGADAAGGELAVAAPAIATEPHRVLVASKDGDMVVAEVEGEKGVMVERSAAFWAAVAPNVDDYKSGLARGIAGGAGAVIRSIIQAGDAAVAQVGRAGEYAESRLAKAEGDANVSPAVMLQIKRVRALSRMTDRVATGVLTGVVRTTGFVSGRLFKNSLGRRAFKLLPGEVAVVSLDAFGRLFDAVELAGTNFLNTTSVVTSGVVAHKYGAKAGEVADDTLATTGNAIHTAWTVAKLRKAIDPRSATGGFSKTQALKGVVKGLARPKV